MTTLALTGVFAVILVGAAAQAVSGFGFVLIAAPLVAVLAGAKAAVVGVTLVGWVLVAQLSVRGRGHVDRSVVLLMTASAIVGMPLGLLVLDRADERVLTAIIAVVVIAFAVVLARGLELPRAPVAKVFAGLTSGVLATSTGTSGPPVVIALSDRTLEPSVFRATISTIFLVQGTAAIVAFAFGGQITSDALLVALVGLPGLLLGSIAGEWGFRSLDPAAFRRVVLAMLFVSGVAALIGALLT